MRHRILLCPAHKNIDWIEQEGGTTTERHAGVKHVS
jgi:hypothetical protein